MVSKTQTYKKYHFTGTVLTFILKVLKSIFPTHCYYFTYSKFMIYTSRAAQLTVLIAQLEKRTTIISFFRVLFAGLSVFFFYKFLNSASSVFLGSAVVGISVFVYLVIKYYKYQEDLDQKRSEREINQQELDFINQRKFPLSPGTEYLSEAHPYTFDLDIFGQNSLFHYLNRTHTFPGEKALAGSLLQASDVVIERQNAVKELAQKLDFRQEFAGKARRFKDSKKEFEEINQWIGDTDYPEVDKIFCFIVPLIFLGTLTAFSLGLLPLRWLILSIVVNLFLTGRFLKSIQKELAETKRVGEIFNYYSGLISRIEREEFKDPLLLKYRLELSQAGVELKKVGSLFQSLYGIRFGLGALMLNSTIQYHVHVLRNLIQWKKVHASSVPKWIESMGEMEALMSLGNFAYQHPEFAYPELTGQMEIHYSDMGHPLIPDTKRVNNSISLTQKNFMILTGSNMSGKSTFLRSIGVNHVLAGAGAPVCAKSASVSILPLYVSMRQSDSLISGESYFFAEVKRLRTIMDALEQGPTLILLDEILRGTNSDDKQSGTMGVIRKVINGKALGGIATHDLEVCSMVEQYPGQLENYNFEVEIKDDQLLFDYTLRKGICQNKSATFLMKKMEII